MKLHISTGNTKLGNIHNISLPPIVTCSPDIKCGKDCYARGITRRWKAVRLAWERNLAIYKSDHGAYFTTINDWLVLYSPAAFRWHVGGDIPDRAYLDGMIDIAKRFPHIKFMFFTKRYDWVTDEVVLPTNLRCRISAWPYMKLPESRHPKAWIRGDMRAPADAAVCTGKCEDCMTCWDSEEDIILKPH